MWPRVPATVDLYPDGSSFTTVVVLVRGIASGTAIIRASAPPFIPEITATITVGSAGTRVPASITATGGTSQSAAVNNTFAAPLAVTVRMRREPCFRSRRHVHSTRNRTRWIVCWRRQYRPNECGRRGDIGGVYSQLHRRYVLGAGVGVRRISSRRFPNGKYSIEFGRDQFTGQRERRDQPVSDFSGQFDEIRAPARCECHAEQQRSVESNIPRPLCSIAAGATTAAVQPRVGGVNFGSANITASAPGYSAATESVRVAAALAFAPSSVTIQGTNTENLTLTLSAPAPAGGLIVTLKSDRTTVATVPWPSFRARMRRA